MQSNMLIARNVGSEMMVYDPEHDEIHILNPSACLIYKLHEEGKTVAEIEEEMRSRFDVDKHADIAGDILRCIESLKKKELTARDT